MECNNSLADINAEKNAKILVPGSIRREKNVSIFQLTYSAFIFGQIKLFLSNIMLITHSTMYKNALLSIIVKENRHLKFSAAIITRIAGPKQWTWQSNG
jgi:hypothetical protein